MLGLVVPMGCISKTGPQVEGSLTLAWQGENGVPLVGKCWAPLL